MRKWLRRIRGAIGMGFIWAVALSAAGSIPRWVLGFNTDAPIPFLSGVFGFVAGVTFSGLLMLTEGRHRFDQLSLPRFAAWGAMGGLLLSALWSRAISLGWGDTLAVASAFTLASAACASGSLVMARRATRRALPDNHRDMADVELADDEQRQLR